MANAVDFASAGRPPLNWRHRRFRSRDYGPALLLRALQNLSSGLRMRVPWRAPRLLFICNSQTRSRACSAFATGTRSK